MRGEEEKGKEWMRRRRWRRIEKIGKMERERIEVLETERHQ